ARLGAPQPRLHEAQRGLRRSRYARKGPHRRGPAGGRGPSARPAGLARGAGRPDAPARVLSPPQGSNQVQALSFPAPPVTLDVGSATASVRESSPPRSTADRAPSFSRA